jgi:integrase
MSVKVREKKNRLYLDVYVEGRRRWEALGISTSKDRRANAEAYRLAEIVRAKREAQIMAGEWGLLDPLEGKRTLVDYCERLAATHQPKDHLPKSLKYLREYAQDVQLGQVTERFLEGFQANLLANVGKQTAAHYYAAIKTALRRAVRDRVIPRNPADAVKGIKAPEAVKVHLDQGEINRLAATPIGGDLGAEVKKAFLFALTTGLRISDLRGLTWGEIERDPLQIARRQQKTGRVVTIPLNVSAWRIIDDKKLHRRDEKVFPRLTQSSANTNQYIVEWAKRAGVDKPIGWHTARHTFAIAALESGTDFFTLSKLMGHTKLTTTAVYAKATDRLKRQAVEALPAIKLPKAKKA